jgi:molybdopterin molybdotransferase
MPGLLPVDEAVARVIQGVAPLPAEQVAVEMAQGRVLAEPLVARRTQPPFDASAMDGYAVRAADAGSAGARLALVGTASAGRGYGRRLEPGQAVRIATGAPVPAGADAILIQENATVAEATVTVVEPVTPGRHIRRAGYDFREGSVALSAGTALGMRELALAAAVGYGDLAVRRQPRVAVIATGDELVPPGTRPGPDQIVATNALAVAAHARASGAEATDLGIARDELAAIEAIIDRALGLDPDVIVTIGGASVGDRDLVQPALAARGLALDFWRIAMRPGKPLMFGRMDGRASGRQVRVLGLPGNPASSIVCALVFLTPLLDALLGRPLRDLSEAAVTGADLPANDQRQDYVRARLARPPDSLPVATPLPVQDSGMLSALAAADCLLIRPANAPAARAGAPCRVIRLR